MSAYDQPDENAPSHTSGAERQTQLEADYGGSAVEMAPTKRGGLQVALNQMLVAAFFVEENLILHEPDLKTFFAYEEATGVWKPVTENSLLRPLDQLLQRVLAGNHVPALHAKRLRTRRQLTDLIGLLRGLTEERDVFGRDQATVHAANCVLQIGDDGYCRTAHHPSYYGRFASPVAFDAKAACPQFDAFLRQALPDAEDPVLLQVLAGQWLTGRNLAHAILLMVGNAGTGKSTLMAILRGLIGSHNCTELRTAHLNGRFEMFHYLGKSLLIGSDVPADFLSGDGASALKKLTGEDWVSVEQKFGGNVDMEASMNVGITANSHLRVKLDGDQDAWRRRLAILEFTAPKPSKPEPQLAKRLLAEEGSGILNWALQGLAQLMRRKALGKGLPLSARHRASVDNLLEASDSLNAFLRDGVEITESSDVSSEELCQAYRRYCAGRGWVPVASAERYMKGAVEDAFGIGQSHNVTRAGRACRGYRGLSLKGGIAK